MTLSRQNILCGLCTIGFGLVLLSQTFGPETENYSDGLQAMDYPRFLVWLLIALGVGIALYPTPAKRGTDIPLFSQRICALIVALLLYATVLDAVGFAVSGFCLACVTGYIMGWRNITLLVLFNLGGIGVIWLSFRYILKIPLPAGYLI